MKCLVAEEEMRRLLGVLEVLEKHDMEGMREEAPGDRKLLVVLVAPQLVFRKACSRLCRW